MVDNDNIYLRMSLYLIGYLLVNGHIKEIDKLSITKDYFKDISYREEVQF